jgi:DNA repair exonuclease SbcCD ATPase subunit
MYIRRVVLENLRGFRELDFDFERPDGRYSGWAVITGDNAAGKTAFLKAIALALVGTDTARALQPSLQGWIRRGAGEAVMAVEIVAGDADKFAQGRRYEHPFWSELKLSSDPGPLA